ncbi:uncharacterized protein LOC135710992 [Ochlerotatus camptorhynchus]|uniref:uncharacterized protein LOC135710992 n=1 Tax=Ochlerotatus camptorhynchus TaxID=644619 RepID=UPI0031D7F713
MNDESSVARKTVPPLRIKNVRSLQTVHISDEESPLSVDTGSTSENDNLIIDEMEEPAVDKDEPIVIETTEPEGGAHTNRRTRKRTRKQKPVLDEDRILVIDGDTIGSDEYEQDLHSSSRVSSNRHSINSDESMAPSGVHNTSSHSSKGSRRKSHHVPKQVGDVVFEEATILTVDDDEDDDDDKDVETKEDDKNDPNRNLMKNIAMLRTCINYVLVQQNYRPMSFKHNFESTSKMVEYYNQLKTNKK